VPPQRRGRAMPLMAGTLMGALLMAGGGAAMWYFSPNTLKDLQTAHPDYKKPPTPLPPANDLQKATALMAQGQYDQAITQLTGKAGGAEQAALGEARWLKYVKEQNDKKQPLKADDESVKAARKELEQSDKDHPVLKQMDRALVAEKLQSDVALLQVSDKAFREVRDVLEKNKIADPAGKVEDLPKVIGQALTEKEQAEKLREGIGKALVDAKLIADKKDFDVPVFEKLLKDLGDQKSTLVAVNKLLEEAKIKDSGDKGVKEALVAKKDAEDKISDVNKVLADEKLKEEGAKGVLELVETRNKLTKDRDDLATTVKSAFDELADAKIVPADGDARKLLVEGTKRVRARGESPLAIPLAQLSNSLAGMGTGMGQVIESGLATTRLATELSFYRLREPLLVTPEKQLDAQIAVLQDRDRRDAGEITEVLRASEWLLSKEAAANAESRGKACYAAALALRNQGKYDEARKSLTEALDEAKTLPKAGPWAQLATQTLRELTDPRAYYLPRVEQALDAGNYKQALAEANTALKIMPSSGALLAERARVRLEESRRRGKVADEQKEIRADAEAAQKDAKMAAAGSFALGQLEEELGNLEGAEKLYREAIKANEENKGTVQEGYRYRIALARVLQRERGAVAAPLPEPAPRKEEEKAKAEEKTSLLRPAEWHPLTSLVLAATLGAQPADDEKNPAEDARLRESIDIAKQLIKSDDNKIKGQGHVLLGQALSKQGLRTEGLREVAKGLALLHPDMSTEKLGKLLDEHPAFQHPDAAKEPNPYVAERFFGLGLHHYWERRYAEAEAEFKQAVGHFDQDARYQYFLGLSQLAQASQLKRDAAYFSFEKGARLEAMGNPRTTDEINLSLERVQGKLRQDLNAFRIRVLTKTLSD
jgi:hypothetical protein